MKKYQTLAALVLKDIKKVFFMARRALSQMLPSRGKKIIGSCCFTETSDFFNHIYNLLLPG